MRPTPGVGRGHIGGASSGHNTRDTDFSVRYLRIVVVVLVELFLFIVFAIAVIIAVAVTIALALLAGRRGPREQKFA